MNTNYYHVELTDAEKDEVIAMMLADETMTAFEARHKLFFFDPE